MSESAATPEDTPCPACGVKALRIEWRRRRRQLVDSATAARMLEVTPTTVRQFVRTGQLVNHGSPGRLLLDRQEIRLLFATRSHAHLRRLRDKLTDLR